MSEEIKMRSEETHKAITRNYVDMAERVSVHAIKTGV